MKKRLYRMTSLLLVNVCFLSILSGCFFFCIVFFFFNEILGQPMDGQD